LYITCNITPCIKKWIFPFRETRKISIYFDEMDQNVVKWMWHCEKRIYAIRIILLDTHDSYIIWLLRHLVQTFILYHFYYYYYVDIDIFDRSISYTYLQHTSCRYQLSIYWYTTRLCRLGAATTTFFLCR